MAITKSTTLRNRLMSQYNTTQFQMAVVSDLSEDLIMKRIASGSYEVVIIKSCTAKFFIDQHGKRHVYAVGINADGSIVTS